MYEQHSSGLKLVNCVWRAVVSEDDRFVDPANEYWGLAFTEHTDGRLSAELIGPSLTPRQLYCVRGERHWGVEFKAHIVLRGVKKPAILGAIAALLVVGRQVLIAGVAYSIPSYETIEDFVVKLERDGVIVSDEAIERSLNGDVRGLSRRSWQRQHKDTTGVTKKQIEQLRRARYAFFLLQQGYSVSNAAAEAGFADQAHMTRAFKLLRSETPGQIIARHLGG